MKQLDPLLYPPFSQSVSALCRLVACIARHHAVRTATCAG